jgi:ATP-dependent protease ClpP protease subunit
MSDDMKILPMFQQNKTFTTEFRGVKYEYYLTGAIGAAEDYLDLCNILRSSTSQDEIVIRINCPGGSVNTGNMIINAIFESEANVVGFIESECGSMATFIFLACDTWGVSEAAEFFCHTCSYGNWGKEHECFAQAEFLRKQQHKMTRKRYSNFLDDDQIERLLLGQDVYLDADEIMDRLELYAEARDSQGCGDPNCEGCSQEPEVQETVDDLIAEAVDVGITKALDKLMKKYVLTEKEVVSKAPSKKTAKALEQAKVIKEAHKELDEKLK